MRITNTMMTDSAIRYMNESKERLVEYQEMVSSGKAFQKMSDDPSRAAAAMGLRSSLNTNEAYTNTAENVSDWMSANETAFSTIVDLMTRARNLVLQGQSDTLSAKERTALGTELASIVHNAVDVVNSSVNGRFLFGGYQTGKVPFTMDPAGTAVTYNGDNGVMTQEIGPGQSISINFPGNSTFAEMFNAMIKARDDLLNNNSANLETRLSELASATATVTTIRTTNSTRLNQVTTGLDSLEKAKIEIKSLLSKKEDANLAEAISYLSNQESVYQTVLEVSQRAISSMNLFDVIG